MPVSVISSASLCGVQALRRSPPIWRVSKVKCSWLSAKSESLEALAFKHFLRLRTYFNALDTGSFSYLPLSGRFLLPWNLTRPAPPLEAVGQVEFMSLVCASMTLYEFIECPGPGPCRGHIGKSLFLVFCLLASSSKWFAAWYDPFLCANLAGWWCLPDCLFFCFGDFLHPESGKFPQQSRGAHRTQQSPWGLG